MLRTEINGVHSKVDDKLRKYINKKIGSLDKYVPRHARASAYAEVRLKEFKSKDKKQCSCEVILHVPIENIAVKETTINMFAAVDIAEEKLKHALRKYKDVHDKPRLHRRIAARIRRRLGRDEPVEPTIGNELA
jgi:ribosomal subunit interface protein